MTSYETTWDHIPEDYKEGEIINLKVKDRSNYRELNVTAKIKFKRIEEEKNDWDRLLIGRYTGGSFKEGKIKILEESERDIPDTKAGATRDLGERRGYMLRSMIEEREEEKE